MKKYSQVRGIVVSVEKSGEKNSRLQIYTEMGLLYATAYGGRGLTSSLRGSDALFSMGRFSLEEGRSGFYKLYDAVIYEHCFSLSSSLACYYGACFMAEIVRYMQGTHHTSQFKMLVDALLYAVSISSKEHIQSIRDGDVRWYHATRVAVMLLVFLWRSFLFNGWQPSTLHSHESTPHSRWVLTIQDGVFVPAHATDVYAMRYDYIQMMQNTDKKPFLFAVESFLHAHCTGYDEGIDISKKSDACTQAVFHLITTWEHILERNLRLAQFLKTQLVKI